MVGVVKSKLSSIKRSKRQFGNYSSRFINKLNTCSPFIVVIRRDGWPRYRVSRTTDTVRKSVDLPTKYHCANWLEFPWIASNYAINDFASFLQRLAAMSASILFSMLIQWYNDDEDDHVDDIDGVCVTIQTANFETMAHREPLFCRKVEKRKKEEEQQQQ